jgi:hypothetical protein
VHESRRQKLAPPLADSKDEIWDPKSPPSAIPNVGVSFQITQTPLRFSRGTTCGIASQPTRPGSALDRRVLRDFEATQQEILASNNLKGKRRTINTSLVSETRERSAQLLPDIPLDRTRAAASNGGAINT